MADRTHEPGKNEERTNRECITNYGGTFPERFACDVAIKARKMEPGEENEKSVSDMTRLALYICTTKDSYLAVQSAIEKFDAARETLRQKYPGFCEAMKTSPEQWFFTRYILIPVLNKRIEKEEADHE
jgi:hypothetical protein